MPSAFSDSDEERLRQCDRAFSEAEPPPHPNTDPRYAISVQELSEEPAWKAYIADQVARIGALSPSERDTAWHEVIKNYIDTVIPMSADQFTRKTDRLISLLAAAPLKARHKSQLWRTFVYDLQFEAQTQLLNRFLKRGHTLATAQAAVARHPGYGFTSEEYTASDGAIVHVGNDGELIIFEPSGVVSLGRSSYTAYDLEKARKANANAVIPDPNRRNVRPLTPGEFPKSGRPSQP